MRALAVATLVLACVTPARAETWQQWGGSVSIPTPDAAEEDSLRPARCAYLNGSNGALGWVISLPAELADGVHPFRVIDAHMSAVDGIIDEPANFDVAFYTTLASCDAIPAPEAVRFRSPGNESGLIPTGSRFALITLTNKVESAVDFLVRTSGA